MAGGSSETGDAHFFPSSDYVDDQRTVLGPRQHVVEHGLGDEPCVTHDDEAWSRHRLHVRPRTPALADDDPALHRFSASSSSMSRRIPGACSTLRTHDECELAALELLSPHSSERAGLTQSARPTEPMPQPNIAARTGHLEACRELTGLGTSARAELLARAGRPSGTRARDGTIIAIRLQHARPLQNSGANAWGRGRADGKRLQRPRAWSRNADGNAGPRERYCRTGSVEL